jgi:hypothetical protein
MPYVVVDWETDGDETVDLPSVVYVPKDIYLAGCLDFTSVTDWLSDTFGWLVRDWRLDED